MARYTSFQVYFANGGEQLTLSLLFVLMSTMKDGTLCNSKKLGLHAGDVCERPNYIKFVGIRRMINGNPPTFDGMQFVDLL